MKVNEKIKTILKLVLEQIAEIYLYFLGFYVICLVLSYFFKRWESFFNWPAFHISVIVFGVLALLNKILNKNGKRFFLVRRRFTREKFINFITKFKVSGIKTRSLIISIFAKIKKISKKISKINYIKIGFIIISLSYSLYKGLGPIDFLIFGYALVSVLFILESRIAAVIALLFLVSCPVLLILKKAPIAETMAIYAYYFLIIATAIQVREYWREARAKVIHS